MARLESALRKYKAGDYQGVIREHAHVVRTQTTEQALLLVLAQSFLKTGSALEAARSYRRAGEVPGSNHQAYLLIAGNLYLRHSAVEDAYGIARILKTKAPRDPQVLEYYHRVLRETCLFEDIETENVALLAALRRRDPQAIRTDNPFSNVAWCDDEAVNAGLIPATVTHPVDPAMRAARRARPHAWGPRLRIGCLSDDYYDTHATMTLFQGVMMQHDRDRFDITHFCTTSPQNIAKDSGRRSAYPNLVSIARMTDADAADFIRAREIDILVDLKGHTQGCRPNLINLGLAPVQVAFLGFPGSGNGIDCDYVLSDHIVTPDSSIPHYHEKLCRLPDSYQPNDTMFRPRPPAPDRASLGLPEDRVVFGFFNATRKLTPATFRLTMDILRQVPDSVLWILFFNDFARANFLAAAEAAGVGPERIVVAPKARYSDHIARLRAADIALDAFPYNGHTTTSDALWAGVPVPTFRGRHFASRVSESLLTALDLPELVAQDENDYVALNVRLARDAGMRQALRARIEANRLTKPLFDTKRFARHLEHAFELMAERARQGLAPDHIDVPGQPANS